jgi:hypothetical protein
LQGKVQGARAGRAAVHRAEHLNVTDGIETKARRDALCDHLHELGRGPLGIGCLDKIEIARCVGRLQLRHDATVDAMGIDDDAALAGLPEYVGQARHGELATTDQIGQHLARSNRRQLVDITHDQQSRALGHGLQDAGHERHVDHGYFIQDEQIALERKVRPTQEPALLGIELKQAMDSLGLEAGTFG